MRRGVIPVFVPHLGCPHRCVFCDQQRISGAAGFPDAAHEIETALEKIEGAGSDPRPLRHFPAGAGPDPVGAGEAPRPQIAFYGGSFTAIPVEAQEGLLEIGSRFVRAGRADSLRCSTRPDCIDAAVLARLRRYGVRTVELGAQSMDAEVLRLSQRGHSPEDTERAARLLKAGGFELVLQMMTGLPGDTPEKSLETARRLIALAPDAVRIYPTAVLPGTELERLWRAGTYAPQSVEQAVELCAALLEQFTAVGIPVIRLGLNPTPELDRSVLAGAYHPAFGDMVKGRVFLRRVRRQLGAAPHPGRTLVLTVPPNALSTAIGHRRCNAGQLQTEYDLAAVRFVPGPEERVEIRD